MSENQMEEKVWNQEKEELSWQDEADEMLGEKPKANVTKRVFIGLAVLIVIAAALLYFFIQREEAEERTQKEDITTVSEEIKLPSETVTERPKQGDKIEIERSQIPLNGSDQEISPALLSISDHKLFKSIIARKDLIRRFVAVVQHISKGESPQKSLDFLVLPGGFKTEGRGETLTISSKNFKRYKRIISALELIKPEWAARFYLKYEQQIQKAYLELGEGQEPFVEVLKSAMDQVNRTPDLTPSQLRLIEQTISYAYQSEDLESLSDAQKLFLRIGPENRALIKSQCQAILDEILKLKKSIE